MPSPGRCRPIYHGRPAREGIFHIHVHPHRGETGMSGRQRAKLPKMMPGFQSVGREAAHGMIILSLDHGSGWVWLPGRKEPVARRHDQRHRQAFGRFCKGGHEVSKERFSRQSFLGLDSEDRIGALHGRCARSWGRGFAHHPAAVLILAFSAM